MDLIPLNLLSHRMAPVVALVVGLHAALLAVPLRSARPHDGASEGGHIQVRVLAAVPLAAAQAVEAPRAARDAPNVAAPRVQPSVDPTLPVPAERAAMPTPDIAAVVTPPIEAFGLVVPGIDSADDYFPRSMLTLAPSPLEMVMIEYPPIENDQGQYTSELTLFIDETGRVARVRVDGAELPFELEAAARNAFINARFRSGELDGRAVKSQIRIEVTFDSRSGNA
jgi:periplasmic protein TonB